MIDTVGRWERKKERGLFLRFALVSVLVPAFSFALVYAYTYFSAIRFDNQDWSNVALCLWLGTLLSLGWTARSAVRDKMEVYDQ